MARFNTAAPARPRGPVRSETVASGTTFEGAPGYAREAKSELFLGAVTNLMEDSFYESASERSSRLRGLIEQVAVADGDWTMRFVRWLRTEANLRSVSVFVAVEAVRARLAAGAVGENRGIIRAAIARADEPSEVIAYATSIFGRSLPKAVKRGVADAVADVYTERSWLKWRGKGKAGSVSFRDVLNLVHPTPKNARQAELFEQIIADGYGRKTELGESLLVLRARDEFAALSVDERRARITAPGAVEELAKSGITWEALAGFVGKLTSAEWEAVIPSMGYTALRMNLRNFVEAGVSDSVLDEVAKRLADPEEVRKSGTMPVAFLSAYRNAPLRFHYPLEQALNHSIANIPALPGRTLVLVDESGSMGASLSERGTLTRMDAAAVFGAALALRGENVTLVGFESRSRVVKFTKSDSVLPLANKFSTRGGTNTQAAIREHYDGHDRVIVLTDEQAYGGWGYYGKDVFDGVVPEKVHAFTWNLAGYERGHAAESKTRTTFGGLSDIGFQLIEPIESGRFVENLF